MQLTNKNKETISQPVQKKPGMWQQLVLALVRPPRQQYKVEHLGARIVHNKKTTFQKLDFSVHHNSQFIGLTVYTPSPSTDRVILYLHGNSSSRMEAIHLMDYLPSGFALASFDFLGCGITEEQYISLGVRESQQIKSVVEFLSNKNYEVILWGRSMGAASALRYGGTNIIVADSPFVTLEKVCKETAQGNKPSYVPSCLVSCLFPLVFKKLRGDVKKKADFDMRELNIKKSVEKISESKCIIFLSGNKDTLINHKHSQELFDTFKGINKKIYIFDGNHNTRRPPDVIQAVMKYISQMTDNFYRPVKSTPSIDSAPAASYDVCPEDVLVEMKQLPTIQTQVQTN